MRSIPVEYLWYLKMFHFRMLCVWTKGRHEGNVYYRSLPLALVLKLCDDTFVARRAVVGMYGAIRSGDEIPSGVNVTWTRNRLHAKQALYQIELWPHYFILVYSDTFRLFHKLMPSLKWRLHHDSKKSSYRNSAAYFGTNASVKERCGTKYTLL